MLYIVFSTLPIVIMIALLILCVIFAAIGVVLIPAYFVSLNIKDRILYVREVYDEFKEIDNKTRKS